MLQVSAYNEYHQFICILAFNGVTHQHLSTSPNISNSKTKVPPFYNNSINRLATSSIERGGKKKTPR